MARGEGKRSALPTPLISFPLFRLQERLPLRLRSIDRRCAVVRTYWRPELTRSLAAGSQGEMEFGAARHRNSVTRPSVPHSLRRICQPRDGVARPYGGSSQEAPPDPCDVSLRSLEPLKRSLSLPSHSLPMPAETPEVFRFLPEYLIEDITEFLSFTSK